MLQIDIPATVSFVLVMVQVFRQVHRKRLRNMECILPIVAMIYAYILLGTVETTFNMAFILWFGIIFMMANEKPKQLPQNETAVRVRQ